LLELIRDVDALLGSQPELLFGAWLNKARAAAEADVGVDAQFQEGLQNRAKVVVFAFAVVFCCVTVPAFGVTRALYMYLHLFACVHLVRRKRRRHCTK
jgi:hypothetical protein